MSRSGSDGHGSIHRDRIHSLHKTGTAGSRWLRFANRLKYQAFALAAATIPRFPTGVSYQLGFWVADFARLLTPGRCSNVAGNLRHVLGPEATPGCLRPLTREVFRNIAAYYVDLLRLPRIDVERLEQHGVVEYGYDYLLEALAEGHGVIVVTAHLGDPDLAIQAARARGLQFFVLMEPVEPPALAALYLMLRSSHGHRFLPVGVEGIKEAVRTLRRGGTIILVTDRDIQGNGVMVPFFGSPAPFPSGAVELARRTGAPIIPAHCIRLSGGRLRVTVEPRVPLIWTGDRTADLRANLGRVLQCFEQPIREAPGQWLVLERVWPQRAQP